MGNGRDEQHGVSQTITVIRREDDRVPIFGNEVRVLDNDISEEDC